MTQHVMSKTVWFLVLSAIVLIEVAPNFGWKYMRSEIKRVENEPLPTIPSSCTSDARMLCDPFANPLQSLMNEDPFVRMIMITPIAPASPEASTQMLEDLFAAPSNARHLAPPAPPAYEQEDAVIGAMLEEMMTSAMRLSAAAEEVTSSTYYGTTESAADEAFVAMLTSLMDLSRQSSGAAEYYQSPDQLSEMLCACAKAIEESEGGNENEPMVVGGDMTRLRFARRLSEVEAAPESPDGNVMFVNGDAPEMLFLPMLRIIIHEDVNEIAPPVANFQSQDDGIKQCFWSSYSSQLVSPSCSRAVDELQIFKEPTNFNHIVSWDMISYVTVCAALLALFAPLALVTLMLCGVDEEEENDEDFLGNEYYEFSESANMNGAFIAVPLRVV